MRSNTSNRPFLSMSMATFLLALAGGHVLGASFEVDDSGSLTALGRAAAENLLSQPLQMRILERQFRKQVGADGPGETDRRVVVATPSDLFDAVLQPATKRELRLVIDDVKVEAEGIDRSKGAVTVTKSDPHAQLSWTSVFILAEDSLEIVVTFKNGADRLRSVDVEFPIPLAGTDYDAFFPGTNDFPEWPADAALGYQLRAGQWDYNSLSQPLATFFSAPRDVGLSVASRYDRPILPITFFAARAKGGTVVLKINGVTMCELDDRDPERLVHGWLALQVHVGPPMCVQFKDIYLRRL